jgi:dTDP-glucose 4,6-dehydratase
MKILVTGGLGFIGSAFIRKIIHKTNFDLLNIDKVSYASRFKNVELCKESPRYNFLKIDISNRNEVSKVISSFNPDCVIHFAAESHVDNSIVNPSAFIESNIVGTFNLLEELRLNNNKHNKSMPLFMHVSTDEVFGELPHPDNEIEAEKIKFSIESKYDPSSPYSASKASSDHLVRAWNRTYKMPCIITNCSNNYGPYQFPEKLIPVVIKNAIKKNKIPVYGNGMQIRDWLYVEDHAEALMLVMSKGVIGNTYLIGGNNEIKNIDLINMIFQILLEEGNELNHFSKLELDGLIDNIADRPGHDIRYSIDISKIRNELGWQPKTSFEEGLRKTVVWYLNNLWALDE